MEIREHVQLKEYTTFRVGGEALFFVAVGTIQELKEALLFCREHKIPFFILGEGSNILVSDEGFPGLVIKNEIKGIEIVEKRDEIMVKAGAGENWDGLVELCVEKGFGGLENLSAIPGTVGAAPVQNIGAYGSEAKDTISNVLTLDSESLETRTFNSSECHFHYRDSFFKKPEGKKYIITHVEFILKKESTPNTSYRDIAAYVHEHGLQDPTLRAIRTAVISIRAAKLPPLTEYGTAGSFFKNPIITKVHYDELKKTYPDLPFYELKESEESAISQKLSESGSESGSHNSEDYAEPRESFNRETHLKVPAAWILDNICGFKGLREGNVGVYKNQALVLVNYGNASAREISTLAEHMIDEVKKTTGIILEPEVQYIGIQA